MPHYRITAGSFRDHDDTVKTAGEEIEMGEDIAQQHPGKLQRIDAPAGADAGSEAAQLIADEDA